MNSSLCVALVCMASALLQAHTEDVLQTEECETPASGQALLQVKKEAGDKQNLMKTNSTEKTEAAACAWELQGDQDGSQPCAHLQGTAYTSGAVATLDEAGYQATSKMCCHHEMSLFVRREITRQGFDVCNLADLHGFVHWYDCNNDEKTFAAMQAELAGASTNNCPFLGHLPNCPVQQANCHDFGPCPMDVPANSLPGSSATLDEAGYAAVAARCCHTEMEQFVRRLIDRERFSVCDEGALQGFLHWFDCTDDGQTYASLKEGVAMARAGLPPMCPWLGSIGEACPPMGHNCPWIEMPEPAAHRRRVSCR